MGNASFPFLLLGHTVSMPRPDFSMPRPDFPFANDFAGTTHDQIRAEAVLADLRHAGDALEAAEPV
jgi:hypothetical protein